jgi:hypothetical protein
MLVDVAAGVLAVGAGVGAIFVPGQRTTGLLGAGLGLAGLILLPTLARV